MRSRDHQAALQRKRMNCDLSDFAGDPDADETPDPALHESDRYDPERMDPTDTRTVIGPFDCGSRA